MEKMPFSDLHARFLAVEERNGVLHQEVAGVRFWERIRFTLWQTILNSTELSGQAHAKTTPPRSPTVSGAFQLAKNAGRNNPYVARRSDIAFVGHPRRKLRADGLWWDIYCDPILEHMNSPAAYFEGPYLGRHLAPAKTPRVYHMEVISQLAGVGRKLKLTRLRLSKGEVSFLRSLRKSMRSEFGVEIPLEKLVWRKLVERKGELPLYRLLLRQVKPRVVVLVVSYGKETLIEACKSLGIPVVELQHGVISPYHVGYSFPGPRRTKVTFPDYLFLFGEFWKEGIEYPLPPERLVSVGYPYLEDELSRYKDVTRTDTVLFISQGTIGRQLSKVAVELSKLCGSDFKVVYKLHPGEYTRWRQEYPWLVDADLQADVQVVADDSVPLYQLFAEARFQVGVNSTALYEGLAFGLRTLLIELPGVEYMGPLVDVGMAEVCRSANEIAGAVRRTEGGAASSQMIGQIFKPNALENTVDAIQAVNREESA